MGYRKGDVVEIEALQSGDRKSWIQAPPTGSCWLSQGKSEHPVGVTLSLTQEAAARYAGLNVTVVTGKLKKKVVRWGTTTTTISQ